MSVFPRRRTPAAHRSVRQAVHRATHGAARRALRQRRSVSARIVVLAILSPALLLIGSTAADAAIVKGFSPVFSTNTNGQIILRGNTNETCDTPFTGYTPAATSTCAQSQAGADGYNNQFTMKYTDVDSVASTFNSSSATIDVPSGSRVLYARLSWSGTRTGSTSTNGAPDATKSNQVKLQGPGATGYTTVTSADPVSVGDTSYDAYGASADVTSYVAARGAGSYTVADIQSSLGNDRYAGWSMAIAYANPSEPVRNLTIFDGWGTVRSNQTLDIPVSGFQTPPNGAVDTRVGVAAFEGDRGLTGDQLSIDTGGGSFSKLSNATNPEGNSFNSTVSQTGVAVAGRTPSYDNTMGEDVDRFNATGLLKNNQTSTNLRLTTTGDVYYPQTVTFATELYAPKLVGTKSATDVNGGNLEPGDQIEYAIDVKNDGLDDAVKSQLTDAIPTNTTYVPGSLTVGGAKVTDAADGDVGRFVADSNQGQVRANIGTGASGTAGGAVAVSGTTRVTFRVTVDSDLYSDTTIPNSASTSYEGAQTGLVLSTSSNNASAAVTANRADLRVRTTADKAVVQRGDTAAYTVEVVNRGPQSADGVQVANTLPAGATVSSITTDQGTCSTADASCDLGSLLVGTTVTIHLVVKLAANTPDPSTVSSKVSAETIDPNPANDTSSASVGVNSPPKASNTTSTTTDGKATVNVLQNATDADGDKLSVSKAVVEPPAHGTVVVNDDGTLTYTAYPGFAGTDTVTYTISDGRGGTVTATLIVKVPNAAPVAQDDAFTAATTGRTDFDVLANDKDANPTDKLTVTDVTKPNGGTAVVNPDGTVGFTPDQGFDGTTTFTYTVSDGNGGTANATVTVTVPNTAPKASDDTADTPYKTPVSIDVLSNDKDDNNDPLSIVPGSVTAPTSNGDPAGTAVVVDGKIRFTPADGFSGKATFDYTITDGNATSTATVTVTVANGAPTAANGTAVSDGTKTQVDVLQYASDPNGDPLTITGITGVAHGSVVLNPDGTVTYYTPTPGYKGSDSFDYTVSDGKGGSATGTIDITVRNQPPTAPDVRRTAPSGVATTIPVLTGAKDPNGDTLSLLKVSQPAHGTLTFDAAQGTITYTPDQDYDGSEVLTFTVSDGDGGTVDATLTIRAVNEAPVVTRDVTSTRATKGGSVTLDVLANDTDPNGDPLTICGLTTPAGGTAKVVDGKLVYTYADDYAGSDVFTYTACDGRGGESTARVIVTVVNDAPVANPDGVPSTRNATATVDVVENDTDANGDALELVGVDDPTDAQGEDAGTATVQDGKVVFTPTRGFTGTATVPYRVRDARGAVSTGTLTVTVGNTGPTANDVTASAPYDTTVSVTPDASDADGDDLSLTAVGAPKDANGVVRGTVTVEDGKAVYNPPAGFSGPVTFGYTVSDGLQSATATMTVTVGNGAPAITGGTTQTLTATGTPDRITTTDPNGDTVTVTVVDGALPAGLTLDPDGTFTRTGPSKPGTYTFTVEACDDRDPQQCVRKDVTLTVDDSAPTAGDASATTPYRETTTVDVIRTDQNPDGVAVDPDDDPLTLTDVGQPQDTAGNDVGTATIVDGKIVFDPPATFSGPVTFGYTVSDGTKSSSGVVTITVGNGAPRFTGGTQQRIGARETPDPVTTSDPNGDAVIVTVLSGDVPTGLTLQDDGTWTGTATTPGSYTAMVQACDDRNPQQCTRSTVTIVVDNTKPVAGDDTVEADYGTTVTYNVLVPKAPNPKGLAYDLDVTDVPTLTDVTDAKDAGGKSAGTATLNADGTITFVPTDGFSGTVTIGYTISDNDAYDAKSASGTLTVVIGNGTPRVTAGTTQKVQKSKAPDPLTLKDPNGDKATVTVLSGRIPTGLTLNDDGTWSGRTTEAGSFVSTVEVCDDRDPAACSSTVVTIGVDDSAPVAVKDTRTTPSGTKVTIPVMLNDDDPDGDPLTITAMTDPVDEDGKVVGKATIVGDSISYVPPVGFRGPVTLTYTVSDGTETATATVTIDVANATPKVTEGIDQRIATGSAPAPLVSSDPNAGDVTSVKVVDGRIPPGLTLDPDGTWSGTATTPGTYVSTVEVCDDQVPAACSTQEVTIRVAPAGSTGSTDGGPSVGGNPVQSVVSSGGSLPSTGSSALLPVAGLMGMVLIALGAGLAMRRRREADTEPRTGPRPAGGSRRPGSRRGRRGSGLWLDARTLLPTGGLRPAAAGVTPGRHTGGRHRHG